MKKCVSVLAREFWLHGKRQTPCCYVFFGFNDGTWLKGVYDDEEYLWELGDSDEIPDRLSTRDFEYNYPYKEYLPQAMNNCGALKEKNALSNNELVVTFSKLSVVLLFDSAKDVESIEVRT